MLRAYRAPISIYGPHLGLRVRDLKVALRVGAGASFVDVLPTHGPDEGGLGVGLDADRHNTLLALDEAELFQVTGRRLGGDWTHIVRNTR